MLFNNVLKLFFLEKQPLTDFDSDILNTKIATIKSDIPLKLFFLLVLISLFVFMPGRKIHSPSLYEEYGFWKPAIILTFLMIGLGYHILNEELKKLKTDLNSSEKIVEKSVVWKKAKSFQGGKYQIYVDNNHPKFMKFEIGEDDYHKIEKGHTVFIEYAEHSKVLLDLKLNMTDNKTNS